MKIVELKVTDFLELKLKIGIELDLQVRQYEDQDRIIYLGQGGYRVVQFSEKELDDVIEFLKRARELQFIGTRTGYLT